MNAPVRILFVWTGVTSYMADCWRALAADPGVALKIVIEEKDTSCRGTEFRNDEVLRGLDAAVVYASEGRIPSLEGFVPNVIFIVGWRAKTCRHFACDRAYANIPKILCFDMPWQWQARKIAARFVLARYLRHFTAAFVPGVKAARYARWLGFKQIERGLFSIDANRFAQISEIQRTGFVYIGRNSSEKRIDDIRAAHRIYRERGGTWDLRLYGAGLEGGFLQPHEMPAVYASAGALVLASDFDPWPLVIAEACAAGCPVICSDQCGNAGELLTRGNGVVFPVGNVEALVRAMETVAEVNTAITGRDGIEAIAPYTCSTWATHVKRISAELTGTNS